MHVSFGRQQWLPILNHWTALVHGSESVVLCCHTWLLAHVISIPSLRKHHAKPPCPGAQPRDTPFYYAPTNHGGRSRKPSQSGTVSLVWQGCNDWVKHPAWPHCLVVSDTRCYSGELRFKLSSTQTERHSEAYTNLKFIQITWLRRSTVYTSKNHSSTEIQQSQNKCSALKL